MHAPPHSATMPSMPLRTAPSITEYPAGTSTVVDSPVMGDISYFGHS